MVMRYILMAMLVCAPAMAQGVPPYFVQVPPEVDWDRPAAPSATHVTETMTLLGVTSLGSTFVPVGPLVAAAAPPQAVIRTHCPVRGYEARCN